MPVFSPITQRLKYNENVWENNLPTMLLFPPLSTVQWQADKQEPLLEIWLAQ